MVVTTPLFKNGCHDSTVQQWLSWLHCSTMVVMTPLFKNVCHDSTVQQWLSWLHCSRMVVMTLLSCRVLQLKLNTTKFWLISKLYMLSVITNGGHWSNKKTTKLAALALLYVTCLCCMWTRVDSISVRKSTNESPKWNSSLLDIYNLSLHTKKGFYYVGYVIWYKIVPHTKILCSNF